MEICPLFTLTVLLTSYNKIASIVDLWDSGFF